MRRVLFATALTVLILTGCLGSDSTGPSPVSSNGWIAGESVQDIPTVLHTVSGTGWVFQAESLSLPGADLNSVAAVDSLTAWAAGGLSSGWGVVLRTTDGGLNWERVGSQADIPEGTLCVADLGPDNAWVGGSNNTILWTMDGGETWYDVADPAYAGNFWQGIYPLSSTDVWVCGGTELDGRILHTTDGGFTWASHADSLLEGFTMISIAAWDQDNIWAVGHGYTVIRTSDGGLNWEIVTPDSLHAQGDDANGLALLGPDAAWVVLDYGNIWRTDDGGQNWTFQTPPQGTEGFFMLRISALDQNTAWVTGRSGYGNPLGVIIHTTDGGSTWTRLDDGNLPGLWDVSFEGELPNN